MAIALRAAGSFAHSASGNVTPGLPASTAQGDILFLCVNSADNVTATLPTPMPVVRTVGAKANTAQPGPDTSAITPGAPLGIATGDLEILIASTIAGGTVSISAAGGGAWTAIGDQDVTSGEHLYAWYRVRAGGDGNPSVQPSSDHCVACRWAITTGTYDSTTPIEVFEKSSETTSDTSFSYATANSTTVDYALAVVLCSSGVDSTTGQAGTDTANANLANIVLRMEHESTSGGGGGYWGATGELATAGAIGTWSQTMVSATPKAYMSFAIRPPSGASAWTKIVESNNGTEQRLTVAWKRAAASEANPLVTHTGGDSIGAQVYGFTGCLASGNVIAQTGSIGSGSGSGTPYTLTATGITPTYTNSGILFVAAGNQTAATGGAAGNNWASWSGTDPTFTEIGDNLVQDGTDEAGLGVAWGLTTDAAATGDRTVTLSNVDSGAHVWQAVLIEFQDASPAAPSSGSLLWPQPAYQTFYIR